MPRILQSKKMAGWAALILASVCEAQVMPAPPEPHKPVPSAAPTVQNAFRTPARLYGTAYSVKIKVARGKFEWVVPVWVKPDEAKSSFDMSLMRLMGWSEKQFRFDEVSLSGIPLDQKRFQQAKSDWAYFPDFAKSCCAGIIGRDILEKYELRFDPRKPAHIEWKLASRGSARKTKIPESDLQGLFRLRGTTFKKHDLTEVPYVLNLRGNQLVFETAAVSPAKKGRTSAVFQFDFLPQGRQVEVLEIPADVSRSAAEAGLKSGGIVTELNGLPIGKLDRTELEQILKGQREDRITLALNTEKVIVFDFKKNQFIAPEPVPSRTR